MFGKDGTEKWTPGGNACKRHVLKLWQWEVERSLLVCIFWIGTQGSTDEKQSGASSDQVVTSNWRVSAWVTYICRRAEETHSKITPFRTDLEHPKSPILIKTDVLEFKIVICTEAL